MLKGISRDYIHRYFYLWHLSDIHLSDNGQVGLIFIYFKPSPQFVLPRTPRFLGTLIAFENV